MADTHNTDPILVPLAVQLFPDIVVEPEGGNTCTIPYSSDRELLWQYGGVLLRHLADKGLLDLKELHERIQQPDEGDK